MTLLGAQVVVAGSHHRYKEIAERFDDPEAPRGSVNIDLEGCIAAMPELFEQVRIDSTFVQFDFNSSQFVIFVTRP